MHKIQRIFIFSLGRSGRKSELLFISELMEDWEGNRVVCLDINLSHARVLNLLLQQVGQCVVDSVDDILDDILNIHICSCDLNSAAKYIKQN